MATKGSRSGNRAPTADDRIVLITGKEIFLSSQYTAMLREALEKAHGEVETFKFEGETAELAAVLDECRSFGLMATHKLVIVDDADRFVNADTRPMLERYAKSPSEQATLVLRAGKWNKGKLDDAIAKVGLVLKCDGVDAATAIRWAQGRASRAYGSSIDPRSATALVERLGADLGKIDAELAKLATAAGTTDGRPNPITPGLIAELVGMTREEESPWVIQEPLLSGDPGYALRELRVVLDNSPKAAHIPVSYACMDLARRLVGISEGMAQGINANTLAKEMKLWGPSRDPIMRLARSIGPARARALFDDCVEADMALKSSTGTPERTLELLALEFSRLTRR